MKPARSALQRDGAPDSRVDGRATPASIPLGYGAAVPGECLDHVVIMNETSLRRHVACYLDYYHGSRSHLSLGKDSPDGRAVQPPDLGRIVAVPKVGGLHHRYERRAA